MPSYISSIGTAVPPNKVSQQTLSEFMIRHLPLDEEQKKYVKLLYRASGIHYRHSVIEDFGLQKENYSFFPREDALEPFPTVSKRMALYQKEAIKLAAEAVIKCTDGVDLQHITHLITVSCTGMYAPGIDIELIQRFNLRTDTQRTSINFMGCYAAFNALKAADQITRNDENANVLLVAVELCSIHLLKHTDKDSLLSNALFGDGAAAVLVQGKKNNRLQLKMKSFYSDMDLDGKEEMSWHISDFGFQMKLTEEVPAVIKKGIAQLTRRLLKNASLQIADIHHFAIHPGGKKILQVIEEELKLDQNQNWPAYTVLKKYGNMSSPTVLFVLKEVMESANGSNQEENILSFAFGPGLTMESMLLKIS